MMTKNQIKLAELVSDYMQGTEGEVYKDFIYKLVREKTDNNLAKKYIKLYEEDPNDVIHLIVDRSYYKELGYPMDRKTKKSTKSAKRKLCKCKK